jgi:DNA-directed RNA polymerase subunit RPC12/RpoP
MASTSSTNTLTTKPEDKKSGKPKPPVVPAPEVWESRAIIKLIEAGSAAECPHCNDRVKFRARHRDQQVICNVYENGVWKRVEQYHLECYSDAGSPHGDAAKP